LEIFLAQAFYGLGKFCSSLKLIPMVPKCSPEFIGQGFRQNDRILQNHFSENQFGYLVILSNVEGRGVDEQRNPVAQRQIKIARLNRRGKSGTDNFSTAHP
jgi:hypothetical protein